MIASLMLALASQTALEATIERTRAGDFTGAWSLAEKAVDPLERAQARVYVRQHAGDLAGALSEARLGAQASPKDPWLTERALAISVSLSRPAPALEALARLDSILLDPNVPNREAYIGAAERARLEVDVLSSAARARDTAENRALFVVLAVGVGSVCALVALARRV